VGKTRSFVIGCEEGHARAKVQQHTNEEGGKWWVCYNRSKLGGLSVYGCPPILEASLRGLPPRRSLAYYPCCNLLLSYSNSHAQAHSVRPCSRTRCWTVYTGLQHEVSSEPRHLRSIPYETRHRSSVSVLRSARLNGYSLQPVSRHRTP
jgi:hypothetical protein